MTGKLNARDIRRKYADKKMSIRFSFPKLEKPVRTEEERERLVKFAQEVAAVEWLEKKPARNNENNIDKTEDVMARRKNETAEIKEEINVEVSKVQQSVSPEESTVVEEKVPEEAVEKAEDTVADDTDGLLKNMTDLVEKEDDENNRVDQGAVVGDSPVLACDGGNTVADSHNDSVNDGNVGEEVVKAKKEEPKQKPKRKRMTYEEMWSSFLY